MSGDPRYREGGTLHAMKKGAVLHCEHKQGREAWSLSTGITIKTKVARAVIESPLVRGDGDSLFGPSQTFRHVEVQQ